MKKKLIIRTVLGVAVSAVIIYFTIGALGGLNPSLLLHADINWGLAALAALIFAFSVFIRAMVYPFGIDRRLGIMESFRIVAVGNAANMLLPLHMGELLRATLFPLHSHASKRTWLIMVPAAIDMLAIFSISELALPISDFDNPSIVNILHIVSISYLALIIILLVLLYFVPLFKVTAKHFVKGSVLKMSLWVFVSWLVMLASIVFGLMAYGYDVPTSVKMSFAVFAATNIVMLIPSTPGGIGLFEYGVVLGLGGFGIATLPAKEVGMLLHIIQYAGLLPLGVWLYIYGIRHRHGERGTYRERELHDAMMRKVKF